MIPRATLTLKAGQEKKPMTVKNMEVAFSGFFTVIVFLLASYPVSTLDATTKVQHLVATSEVDVDASNKPIAVKNMEVAFSG